MRRVCTFAKKRQSSTLLTIACFAIIRRWEKTTSSQGVVSYSGLQIGIREDAEAVAEDYDSDEEEETPVVKKKAAPAKKATEGKTKSKKQADLDEEEEEAVDEEDEDDG